MGHSPPSVVSTGELAKAGETQRLTTCDLIHSLTTKSGRQEAYISICPSTNQNTCHTKVKGGNTSCYRSN